MFVRLSNETPPSTKFQNFETRARTDESLQVQHDHFHTVETDRSFLQFFTFPLFLFLPKTFNKHRALFISEKVLHDELIAAIEVEKAHNAVEDERKSAEQAAKARQQIKDGVKLPIVVDLHSGELITNHRLDSSVFHESFRRSLMIDYKAGLLLSKEKVEPHQTIVETHYASLDSVDDLCWHKSRHLGP